MPEKYDVALSFAAEDRSVARKIALALQEEGIRVFFDQFAESELWGKDLYEHLRKIYEESRLCIVILSESYQRSIWTRQELRNLFAHSSTRDSFSILPVVVGRSPPQGLFGTIPSIEYKESSLPKITEIVAQHLRDLPESHERDHVEPYHAWPMKRKH